MTPKTDMPRVHHGRNLKRIREILGTKQDALAIELGWAQSKVSEIEAKEVIADQVLEQVAGALKVSVDAIKNFNEEATINIIANTITNNDQGSVVSYQPTFNPIDKWMEAMEDIKRLNEKNEQLYKALLKEKEEKITLLEKLLSEQKK